MYLTDQNLDYLADTLYVGLSKVLGHDNVVDYPFKQIYHNPDFKYWFLVQRPGKDYEQDEIIDLLKSNYFNLICISSFRKECLYEYQKLLRSVHLPPLVFIDGGDDACIPHEGLRGLPIGVYFKREYVWQLGHPTLDYARRLWSFRNSRDLYNITFPLPFSIVLETLPKFVEVQKIIDISYRGRASHPRRVKGVEVLSNLSGVRFNGGVYASPGDRKYKLKGSPLSRLGTKFFNNSLADSSDLSKKYEMQPYYWEMARSKIAVSFRGGGRSPSLRYFEIIGMKTLLLSDELEAIVPNNFKDHQHAVFFRKDLKNIPSLVRYYLEENDEREAIIQKGYDHLIKYHTCERRAEYFLDICQRVL